MAPNNVSIQASNKIDMKTISAAIVLLSLATLGQADQTISNVQQALKDQGFYYGEITGETNADTTAAIRRYQIRNGLSITGELNDETLRSIQKSKAATPPPAVVAATPSPAPDTSDLRDDGATEPPPQANISPSIAPPSP